MMKKIIGIIGFGNMGQAIAEQLKNDYLVYVFDKDTSKTKNLSDIKVCKDSIDLIKQAQVLILAVKPQDFDEVLSQIKNYAKNKLVISIAAGINTNYIEKRLGAVEVIRAMPNIAVKIGEGVTCLCKGQFASEEDLDFSENLFDYLGETKIVEENKMDAVTAVSGSGPGFCFDMAQRIKIDTNNLEGFRKFIKDKFEPSLKNAAKKVGFNDEEAEFLAISTGNSCIGLVKKTKISLEELKKQVASKGGTTEVGLEVLSRGGSLEEAVRAAKKRAEELSK